MSAVMGTAPIPVDEQVPGVIGLGELPVIGCPPMPPAPGEPDVRIVGLYGAPFRSSRLAIAVTASAPRRRQRRGFMVVGLEERASDRIQQPGAGRIQRLGAFTHHGGPHEV